jgi:hypothetical protein
VINIPNSSLMFFFYWAPWTSCGNMFLRVLRVAAKPAFEIQSWMQHGQ